MRRHWIWAIRTSQDTSWTSIGGSGTSGEKKERNGCDIIIISAKVTLHNMENDGA